MITLYRFDPPLTREPYSLISMERKGTYGETDEESEMFKISAV